MNKQEYPFMFNLIFIYYESRCEQKQTFDRSAASGSVGACGYDTCTPDGGYYSIVGTDGNR